MLMNWSDDYLIGINKIDEQHKECFVRINQLYEDCVTCEGEKDVKETLDFLGNHVVEHFQTEEAFMQKYNFPGTEGHKQLHEEFLNEYSKLSDEYCNLGSNQVLADKIRDIVPNWLIHHMTRVDTNFARHVKSCT